MQNRGTLTCGDPAHSIPRQLAARGAIREANLRKRFQRAIQEGDLPATAGAAGLARYDLTVKGGLDVQTTGARRVELLKVVNGVASPAKTRAGEKIETWLSMI